MPVVDCIITAAGLSSRMGKWKMMLPWHAGTILDASIKNALQFCNRVILVSGYRATEIHNRYANQPNIIITYNPDYAQGLFTSIKVGAAAVNSGHCFITHGDMPELNNDIFRKIWALRNDNVLIPCYQGQPGHPVLLSKKCLLQAISQPNVSNMRQALLRGKHNLIEINDARITLDIDTPEDFINAQNRHK
ncbi:molybdenum cofactor cytidylyltransferase [Citrobacter amalonaticus]|uniref:molybdenum cofactor cytidylyltransferase n=1 Tax=Citrobacter amalonaticus TaxID=35703 RepID=UPI0005CB012C|nr:molybdenum cofactor cytidylyltransferase [Citrobacter amalonaticus]KKF71702.1 molybdenum cofactor cytidylyltransferase [Vibrio parahaemolyticus]EKW5057579.1 molybdenum cofactor cytidylyltransferase [Citrobacter amalonaticus]ELT8116283.1 molybdenum cofactor cytidylyltransferase [Citrobacter amalonaticus]KKY42876.1 molybdenum cofactor cytidylyltransferase [Vibrio parahaemolyticus]KOP94278.1 molybdenum cofactor cytidylyltransferase [Citrobacter amalonaticus]